MASYETHPDILPGLNDVDLQSRIERGEISVQMAYRNLLDEIQDFRNDDPALDALMQDAETLAEHLGE